MKKIINKLKYIVFIMIGIIIGSTVGIVATNVINANQVGYSNDKAGDNVTTIQDAIDELYLKANNMGEKTETLETSVSDLVITIPNIETYSNKFCIYGADKNYGHIGTISNDTCKISASLSELKYYYRIIATDNNGKIYIGEGTTAGTQKLLSIPQIIYYNPVTNTSCIDYTTANSQTGTKTGCMKWYAYKEDDTTYTMILDHNTTANVAYNRGYTNSFMGTSGGNIGYDLAQLTNTSGWKVTPKLISAQEVAIIVGSIAWSSGSSEYTFDKNCLTEGACSTGQNKYAWVFDYTNGCTSYGCNVADSSTNGYWTSTAKTGNSSNVWIVSSYGSLSNSNVANTNSGLRPVITVSKSVL